jgi:hypothetical protein
MTVLNDWTCLLLSGDAAIEKRETRRRDTGIEQNFWGTLSVTPSTTHHPVEAAVTAVATKGDNCRNVALLKYTSQSA